MLQRLLAPLLLGLLSCNALGVDLSASGGQWTQYKPATPPSPVNTLQLVSRGDEIQVKGSYRLKVNVATGVVDQAPRAGFDPMTDFVMLDGEGPMFWTRSYADSSGPISVRDWSSGAVTGTASYPQGVVFSKLLLDSQGVVYYGGGKIATTGFNGENLQIADTQSTASSPALAASGDWIVVSYQAPGPSQFRTEVYDRHTLAFKTGITASGSLLGVQGNLSASLSGNSIVLRQLPGLALLSSTPLQQQNGTLFDFKMVEGGMWTFEQASNLFAREFRYFDLSNPAQPAAGNRLTPPDYNSYVGDPNQKMQAGPGYLAFGADDKSLWVWKRGGSGPVAKIVPTSTAREGEPASFKVQLSSPAAAAAQVQVSAQSASAVEGQDFAAFSTTVTIAAGSSESALQYVTTLADTTLEANESFILASGTTSGCVVEQTKVPVTIAGNGFNVAVHPKLLKNGSFLLQSVCGISGNYLVGSGYNVPQMGTDYGHTVAVDVTTGAVAGELPGTLVSTSADNFQVLDGILFRNSLDLASAWQVPGFQAIATNVSPGGRLLGPINAQHMLVKKSEPARLVVAKISDGSEVATRTLGSSESSALIAPQMEGMTGPAVVLLDSGVSPEGEPIVLFQILNPATLQVVRSFSWPDYHPQLGTLLKLQAVSGRHAVFKGSYAISAVDTLTGEVRWTVPTTQQTGFTVEAAISGDVLVMRGVTLNDGLSGLERFRCFDLKTGALLENPTFEELAGSPFFGVLKTLVQPTPTGFFVANGRQAASVNISPTRPNVELLVAPFEDNRTGELEIVAKENFSGSHSLAIDEYAEVLENLGTDARLFGTLPQQVNFTAAGTTLPLDCRRPANGVETVRVRAMSSSSATAGATAGFGKTTVTAHVDPLVESPFFTGAPVRSTHATQVAAAGNLLAVGYSFEPDSNGYPTGVVDLYDKSSGAFLRSIQAPSGVTKMYFGASLAITGNRVVIAAPRNRDNYSLPGRVFVFDATTGGMVSELKLKKTLTFGASLAANDSWIAVGAPGAFRTLPFTGIGNRKPIPGTVAVFDAKTFKLRYKATTKGEMLGWAVALDGDTLFAGAPLASLKLPVAAEYAGIVRPYSLPKGKAKGKALPILGALHPVKDGHFGQKVAASSTLLAVHSSPAADGKEAVQVHPRENLKLGAIFGVPGADIEEGSLHVTDTHIIAGGWGEPLRIFDLDDQRPEASYSLTGTAQDVATDAAYFYWADTQPHRALLPAASSARALAFGGDDADLNHDGRTDAIDSLLQQRGAKGMPVKIEAGDARQFRFALDADIPEGTKVSLEHSTNLTHWSPLLAWDGETKRWRDASDRAIGEAGAETWLHDWQAPGAKVFFRTRVEMAVE